MIRRRTVVAMLAFSLALLVRPVEVPPVAACSCMMPSDRMADAAREPRTAVFSGLVGVPTPEGVPVGLTRWFKGSPPAAVVLLDGRGFEDPMGGMCGTNQPPTGTEWIFVAWFNEQGRFAVDLCSTHADLATPEGKQLLADAETVFGPAEPIPVVTAPPLVAATVRPTGTATPADAIPAGGPQIPVGAVLIAGGAAILVLLGVALLLAARRRGGGRPG